MAAGLSWNKAEEVMSKKGLTPIESLERSLRNRFPTARISLDRPRRATGVWFLDLVSGEYSVNVQWQAGKGFGVTASSAHAYGERADEAYLEEEAAYGRIVSLMLSQTETSPPPAVSLRELRKERGLSQAELAAILNKQQGEISKIERRSDLHVSTLADYAKSLDGEMQILIRFRNGTVRRVEIEEASESDEAVGGGPLMVKALRNGRAS
jgi:DNA-binding XRE family transcriptional regulator